MMTEESSARITLKELYVQVQKIQSMLERLEGQLPGIADKLDDLERDVNSRLNDHEERLRKVEMRMWQAIGVLSFAFAILPTLINLFQ
jgi:uncharacterized coiled-coil protein SlyX